MQFLIDIALSLLYLAGFLLLCAWAWRFWVMYTQTKTLNKMNEDFILLEIKIPREIDKSPLATEMAITSLIQGGGLSGWYNRLFVGKLPAFSSLEIASVEGVIHFYVRIDKKFRTLVESSFYAQYPGIEIIEADDYTKKIRYNHLSKDVDLWGANFKLSKSWTPINEETGDKYHDSKKNKPLTMPADFLPIKTYVDLGLDKDPKEEYKIDPISSLLEVMATLGKGEHFWYQILIQDEGVYNGEKMEKTYLNKDSHDHLSLKDMADARKKQIRTSHYLKKDEKSVDEFGVAKKIDSVGPDGTVTKVDGKYIKTKPVLKKEIEMTQDEKDELEIINKKVSKPLARVILRMVYVAKKSNYNFQHVQTVLSFPKLYQGANGLGIHSLVDPYDFPWQRIRRIPWRKEEKFEAYVEREGFFPHAEERDTLELWEDNMFWLSSMRARKIFRLLYESILHPFHHPPAQDVSVMNVEEIATLWHLPGQTSGTPMLPRIDSTKGMAPSNLPR